jgi:hypothetical protein
MHYSQAAQASWGLRYRTRQINFDLQIVVVVLPDGCHLLDLIFCSWVLVHCVAYNRSAFGGCSGTITYMIYLLWIQCFIKTCCFSRYAFKFYV